MEASTASTAELIAVPAGLKDFHQCQYIFPMAELIAVEMAKSHEQSLPVDLTLTRPHLPLMFMEQSQQNQIRQANRPKLLTSAVPRPPQSCGSLLIRPDRSSSLGHVTSSAEEGVGTSASGFFPTRGPAAICQTDTSG